MYTSSLLIAIDNSLCTQVCCGGVKNIFLDGCVFGVDKNFDNEFMDIPMNEFL